MIYASKMHTLRLCWALAVGVAVTLCVFEILPLYETVSMENMMAGRAWVADGWLQFSPSGPRASSVGSQPRLRVWEELPTAQQERSCPFFVLHRDA